MTSFSQNGVRITRRQPYSVPTNSKRENKLHVPVLASRPDSVDLRDKEPERPKSAKLSWLVRCCLHLFTLTPVPSLSFKQVSGHANGQVGGRAGRRAIHERSPGCAAVCIPLCHCYRERDAKSVGLQPQYGCMKRREKDWDSCERWDKIISWDGTESIRRVWLSPQGAQGHQRLSSYRRRQPEWERGLSYSLWASVCESKR